MDTSKEYIKMRLKAKQYLLDGIPPEIGGYDENLCWLNESVLIDLKGDYYFTDGNYYTQLEKQDQLQEMVGDSIAINKLYEFHRFYNTKLDYPTLSQSFSMEQLWLAFVMKEKYNKIWTGEEWR